MADFLTEGDKVQIIGTSFNRGKFATVVEVTMNGAIVDIIDFDFDLYGREVYEPDLGEAAEWYYMNDEMEFISHGG